MVVTRKHDGSQRGIMDLSPLNKSCSLVNRHFTYSHIVNDHFTYPYIVYPRGHGRLSVVLGTRTIVSLSETVTIT